MGCLRLVAALVLSSAAHLVSAAAQCRVDIVAVLPLEIVNQQPVVEVLVNGTRLRMLLDTGAEISMVTHDATGIAGLWEDPWRQGSFNGLGGSIPIGITEATVALTGPGRPFRLAVGELSTRPGSADLSGLLGTDILSDYDIEIDFSHGRLTLADAHQCHDDYAPWQGRWTMLKGARTSRRRVLVPARLGQVDVTAILDSGAGYTVLSADMARRAGVTDDQVAAGTPSTGIGIALRQVPMRRVSLPMAEIGDERFADFAVTVPGIPIDRVDMLLGADYFLRHRVWVSFVNGVVFVQRVEDE